ncbi:PaaI family thioesterase [Burkholderia multivorans]|uniref:PaaI family thioesterase n=1 Tax=Burkholderia multivorans TaxID=87883 RepID=UPI001C2411C1|nr:PaaI family thioesterase [Burkholderia multivorans]MBU9480676.1 PaaI family thioesterase [Burkholderia multivorans]
MNDIRERVSTSFNKQGLMATFGATLALVSEGEVHISLTNSKHLSQQHGFVHAGVVSSILDTACGYAALTKVPAGYGIVTAEFKINFLRPALGDRFLAIGRVENAGKLLTVCAGEVRAFAADNSSYKVVALMQATIANIQQAA